MTPATNNTKETGMNATNPQTLLAEIQETQTAGTYRGFALADIEKVFTRMQNPADWKAPLLAWIPADAFQIAAVACEFYTATELKVTGGPQPITGRILVEAAGYRAGPAGDR